MEGLVPQALASALQANQVLRGGLPRDYLDYMGVVHNDEVRGNMRLGRFFCLWMVLALLSPVRSRYKDRLTTLFFSCAVLRVRWSAGCAFKCQAPVLTKSKAGTMDFRGLDGLRITSEASVWTKKPAACVRFLVFCLLVVPCVVVQFLFVSGAVIVFANALVFFFSFFRAQTEDQRREAFKKKMKKHLGVVVEEALELIDAAADQMGKRWDRPLLF